MSETTMTTGALARAAQVGVETVRFYEREGLLPEPERSPTGYRRYDQEALRRLRFITKAKALGFTLAETKDLLELRVADPASCDDVERRAHHKLAAIEGRIATLERMRGALEGLVRSCQARTPSVTCPILDALDEDGTTQDERHRGTTP